MLTGRFEPLKETQMKTHKSRVLEKSNKAFDTNYLDLKRLCMSQNAHTGLKAEVSWFLFDFDVVEGGLGRGQTCTGRPRVWIPRIHQLLLEAAGREGNEGLRQVALVQRPAVAA